ncbi:DUF211 domain-containing protein [Halobaculum sp. MBLA0147]|uniref:DUF211 domain-containing protein n=1 Tax=Halobaculum sp. MBLA0147 TaxID=3079934 RepID=UPI0035254FE8
MAPVRRIVFDVLKPDAPPLPEFAARLADTDGVATVTASLVEMDREVQTVSVTFEGGDVDVAAAETAVTELGAAVHSVDEVTCGDATGRHRDDQTERAES